MGREQGRGGRCSLGRAWRSTTPVAGAGSGSIQTAGHYWSFTLWVQIWVKMLLLLARGHHKTATGEVPAEGIPLKMLKDYSWVKESNFPSRLHFGIRSMRGIVRSMHHGDKLTLVSKKKKKITLASASRNEGSLEKSHTRWLMTVRYTSSGVVREKTQSLSLSRACPKGCCLRGGEVHSVLQGRWAIVLRRTKCHLGTVVGQPQGPQVTQS